MFANMAEAEKAAAMLRRFGNIECGYDDLDKYIQVWGHGLPEGGGLHDWEQVADFLLAREDKPDGRQLKLTQSRSCVAAVRRQLGWGRDVSDREMITDLVAALEYLLEALI